MSLCTLVFTCMVTSVTGYPITYKQELLFFFPTMAETSLACAWYHDYVFDRFRVRTIDSSSFFVCLFASLWHVQRFLFQCTSFAAVFRLLHFFAVVLYL